MSMNAVFVQVEALELTRIQADPSTAEALFQDGPMIPPVFTQLNETMQARVRESGPQMLAQALSHFNPDLRRKIEERLGKSAAELASGQGGDALLKLMKERGDRAAGMAKLSGAHEKFSLDKEWHGVHYVLCGAAEPNGELLSQAVLGGTILGEDDEGFSGYGAARFHSAENVTAISRELADPDRETQAGARFDAARMNELEIYPGWRPSDRDQVLEALRSLRDFYAKSAAKGSAIVTCIV